MNAIDAVFQRLRQQKKKAFIPFLCAGDPSLEITDQLIRHLCRGSASLVEIGFPYSDPLADGPVIQAAYTRALDRGVRVDDILAMVGRLYQDTQNAVPFVGMLSYSLVHRRGPACFLDQACQVGLSGAIIPDLPF